ncbi:hypothetical protein D3C80_1300500 [compost metagenome]
MNAESIIPAAGMAERIPICNVLAPVSSRRRDTNGRLAPRLKPTTDTANNKPSNKRVFITTPDSPAQVRHRTRAGAYMTKSSALQASSATAGRRAISRQVRRCEGEARR